MKHDNIHRGYYPIYIQRAPGRFMSLKGAHSALDTYEHPRAPQSTAGSYITRYTIARITSDTMPMNPYGCNTSSSFLKIILEAYIRKWGININNILYLTFNNFYSLYNAKAI